MKTWIAEANLKETWLHLLKYNLPGREELSIRTYILTDRGIMCMFFCGREKYSFMHNKQTKTICAERV